MGPALSLKYRIRLHPSLILWLSVLVYLRPRLAMAFLLAAGFHELGHFLCLWGMGAPPKALYLTAAGARMETPPLSYGKNILAAAAGPMASMLLALCWPLCPALGLLSLMLGIFNLLPLGTLDGGKILENLLCLCLPPYLARQVYLGITTAFAAGLLPLGAYLGHVYSLGLWPTLVGALLLLKALESWRA